MYALRSEQLEAPRVHPGQDRDRVAGVDLNDGGAAEGDADVSGPGGHLRQRAGRTALTVGPVHVDEPLVLQELRRYELGRRADRNGLSEPNPGGLGRRLGVAAPGRAEESRRRRQRETAKEPAPVDSSVSFGVASAVHGRPPYPFSSFFSSLKNRQSVPCARIFWGLDWIMPASRSRSA